MTRKMTVKVAGLGMLVAVLAGFSAPAQAADVRAQVPFSFTVNGKALPPGTYSRPPRATAEWWSGRASARARSR